MAELLGHDTEDPKKVGKLTTCGQITRKIRDLRLVRSLLVHQPIACESEMAG